MAKLFYIHYSIDSIQHKNCINSWVTSITLHVSYLSHIIFVVISIYSVQLRYKAIDRLIHFTLCAACIASVARHFKQYYDSISTIYKCNSKTFLWNYSNVYTHSFMVGLGNNGFTNPIISSYLEISSACNPFSSRFPFPVAIHCRNVCRVNGLYNIPPLLPPGNHARVKNSWHLLEYISYLKLFLFYAWLFVNDKLFIKAIILQ